MYDSFRASGCLLAALVLLSPCRVEAGACDDAVDIVGKVQDLVVSGMPSVGDHFHELNLIMIQYDGLNERIRKNIEHTKGSIESYNKFVDSHAVLYDRRLANAQGYIASGSHEIALSSLQNGKTTTITDRANDVKNSKQNLEFSKKRLEELSQECETCTIALQSNGVSFLAQSTVFGSWGRNARETAGRCKKMIAELEATIKSFEDKVKRDDVDHQKALADLDTQIARVHSLMGSKAPMGGNVTASQIGPLDTSAPVQEGYMGDAGGPSPSPAPATKGFALETGPSAPGTSPPTTLPPSNGPTAPAAPTAAPSVGPPPPTAVTGTPPPAIHQNYTPPTKFTAPAPVSAAAPAPTTQNTVAGNDFFASQTTTPKSFSIAPFLAAFVVAGGLMFALSEKNKK